MTLDKLYHLFGIKKLLLEGGSRIDEAFYIGDEKMLNKKFGKNIDRFVSDYVVFDLETTGISTYSDKVVEISAIKVIEGKPVEEFSELVNPQCHIPAGASAVNGIDDEMVKEAPIFSEVLPRFIEFIEDFVLVGHNIESFDLKFIYRDSETFLGKIPDNDYVDTLSMARKCLPEMSHHRMTDLAMHYGISTEGAHRALNDCRMTRQVYELLCSEMKLLESGKKVIPKCKYCGRTMKLRNGKFGEFFGCSGYPNCRYTEKVKRV